VILQPGAATRDSWLPPRMEYNFGCSSPDSTGSTMMRADEYHHGNLEWYALERHPELEQLGDAPRPTHPPERVVSTFMPSSIVFDGCPTRAGGRSKTSARTSATFVNWGSREEAGTPNGFVCDET
jgi:hypothetical protein